MAGGAHRKSRKERPSGFSALSGFRGSRASPARVGPNGGHVHDAAKLGASD